MSDDVTVMDWIDEICPNRPPPPEPPKPRKFEGPPPNRRHTIAGGSADARRKASVAVDARRGTVAAVGRRGTIAPARKMSGDVAGAASARRKSSADAHHPTVKRQSSLDAGGVKLLVDGRRASQVDPGHKATKGKDSPKRKKSPNPLDSEEASTSSSQSHSHLHVEKPTKPGDKTPRDRSKSPKDKSGENSANLSAQSSAASLKSNPSSTSTRKTTKKKAPSVSTINSSKFSLGSAFSSIASMHSSSICSIRERKMAAKDLPLHEFILFDKRPGIVKTIVTNPNNNMILVRGVDAFTQDEYEGVYHPNDMVIIPAIHRREALVLKVNHEDNSVTIPCGYNTRDVQVCSDEMMSGLLLEWRSKAPGELCVELMKTAGVEKVVAFLYRPTVNSSATSSSTTSSTKRYY